MTAVAVETWHKALAREQQSMAAGKGDHSKSRKETGLQHASGHAC